MIQRPIPRPELRRGADGFGDKYFGARYGFFERRAFGQFRGDCGRKSTSAAMGVASHNTPSAEFAHRPVTVIQYVDRIAPQMPALDQHVGRAKRPQLFTGTIHGATVLNRETCQGSSFVEIGRQQESPRNQTFQQHSNGVRVDQ